MKLEPIKILLAWATENTHEPVSTALTPKKKTLFFFFAHLCVSYVTPKKSHDYFRNTSEISVVGR